MVTFGGIVMKGYLYYNDGNSSQWVDISTGPMGAQGAQGTQGSRNNLEVSENAPS